MAEASSSNEYCRFDMLHSDEEDYTDENFSKFLQKTKENLATLSLDNQENNSDQDEDQSDAQFLTFLSTLKNESLKVEKSNCSFSPCSRKSQNDISSSKIDYSSQDTDEFQDSETSDCKDFAKDREACAINLYKRFNKMVFQNKLPENMPIKWTDTLKTTAGKTIAQRKGHKYESCHILLSSQVLTTFERLRDTLLHEMCHAAVFLISQIRGVNHGPLWHTWAARCKMVLPKIPVPERCHTYELAYKYYYQCNKCSWKCGRFRITAKLSNCFCPKCHSSLSLIKG